MLKEIINSSIDSNQISMVQNFFELLLEECEITDIVLKFSNNLKFNYSENGAEPRVLFNSSVIKNKLVIENININNYYLLSYLSMEKNEKYCIYTLKKINEEPDILKSFINIYDLIVWYNKCDFINMDNTKRCLYWLDQAIYLEDIDFFNKILADCQNIQQEVDFNTPIELVLARSYMTQSLLIRATRVDGIDFFNKILKLPNIDVNVQDSFSKTPILYAIENEDLEKINKLLNRGASVLCRDINDKGCRRYAKTTNNLEIKTLICDVYASQLLLSNPNF